MNNLIELSIKLPEVISDIVIGAFPIEYIKFRTALMIRRKKRELDQELLRTIPLAPKDFGPMVDFGCVRLPLSRLL